MDKNEIAYMKSKIHVIQWVLLVEICIFIFINSPISSTNTDLLLYDQQKEFYSPIISSLSLNESLDLFDDGEVAAIATSGSGDPLDPYVIDNLNFGLDSGFGIRIRYTSVSILINNCIFYPFEGLSVSGIEITDTTAGEITIQNCNLTNCITGIFLDNILGSILIDQCIFQGLSNPLIQFGDGYSVAISACDFQDNVYGAKLNDCTYAEITDSNFTQTDFYAIEADGVVSFTCEGNFIHDQFYGLEINGDTLLITENQILNCFIGIRIDESNIVILSQNNLTDSLIYSYFSQQVVYESNNQTITAACEYGGQDPAVFAGMANLTYTHNRLINLNPYTDITAFLETDEYLWVESNFFEQVSLIMNPREFLNCTNNEFIKRGIQIDDLTEGWFEVVDTFSGNTLDGYSIEFIHHQGNITISGIRSQLFAYNCTQLHVEDLVLPTVGGGIILSESEHGLLRNITSFNTYSQFQFLGCYNMTVIDCNLEGIQQSLPTGDYNLFARHSDELSVVNSSFSHFPNGLVFQYCDNVTVENNVVSNCSEIGISFYGSHNFSIIESEISSGNISIYANSDGQIINNSIDTGTLFLPWNEAIQVINNSFIHGGIDARFDDSTPIYRADHIVDNLVNTLPILIVVNASSSHYNLSEYGQAIILNCQDLEFTQFHITDTYTGFIAKDCNNLLISSGSMEQVTNGLVFDNCSMIELKDLVLTSRNASIFGRIINNFTVQDCSIQKGLRSIHLEGGFDIEVSDSLLNASVLGLHVYYCSGSIHDNIIDNNSELGVYLTECFDLIVESNWVMQSQIGIYVWDSMNITFAHNFIVLNEEFGLYIKGGDQLTMIVNFIFDNYDGTAPLQIHFNDPAAIMLNTNQLLGSEDYDNDGISNEDEIYLYFTNPERIDSDNDGFLDGFEIANGTDPLDNTDFPNLAGENPSGTSSTSDSTITDSNSNSTDPGSENFLGIPPQYYFFGSSGILIISVIILMVGKKRK